MDVLVRFWSESEGKVVVHFLKALFFEHAKGVNVVDSITKVICDEELKFPAGNLFNLIFDGPNVNKTIWKKVNEVLEDKQMELLLPFIPYTVHAVHNSFREGLSCYGNEVEELPFHLHYWFERSPCK